LACETVKEAVCRSAGKAGVTTEVRRTLPSAMEVKVTLNCVTQWSARACAGAKVACTVELADYRARKR
jgi:hypothetical protein